MDALALLCNLHADGPTTLHHLRGGGCDSITDVANCDTGDLERVLGWNAKTARRFQREARILAGRLGGETLEAVADEEEGGDPPRTTGFLEEIGPVPAASRNGGGAEAVGRDRGGPVGSADLEFAAGASPGPAALSDSQGRRAMAAADAADLDEEDYEDECVDPADLAYEGLLALPLSSAVCEGLTDNVIERLARAGVRSLGDLVDGEVLEIAGLIGIGYTRLARIRFLTRRHLEGLKAKAQRDAVDVIPARRPAPDRLGSAGPFA